MVVIIRDPGWFRKLSRRIRKTKRAQAERAARTAQLRAEIAAFEQRERFTLLKRRTSLSALPVSS